jgi:hypothetical protein
MIAQGHPPFFLHRLVRLDRWALCICWPEIPPSDEKRLARPDGVGCSARNLWHRLAKHNIECGLISLPDSGPTGSFVVSMSGVNKVADSNSISYLPSLQVNVGLRFVQGVQRLLDQPQFVSLDTLDVLRILLALRSYKRRLFLVPKGGVCMRLPSRLYRVLCTE